LQLGFSFARAALVHRLDPGVVPFRKARSFDVHVSGGEYNVAANLADCFGMRTGVATAMVNYPIGELVQARVRENRRDAVLQAFRPRRRPRAEHRHGVQRSRHGVRGPVVFYNRANEAGALLQPGDFDGPRSSRAECAGSTPAGFSPHCQPPLRN